MLRGLREIEEGQARKRLLARAQMSMREPGEYGNDEVPIPVFYVLEIYQETFRHEKPVVEIHTAEPLSPISVGDYLYEVSFSRSAGGASRSYFCRWRQSSM